MKGIDISMHNGPINFTSVANSGIQAVYIKATEGVDYVDPMYSTYLNGVKNSSLLYGMYHFMSEKTDPSSQAIDFWNAISGSGFTLFPALDIETNNQGRTPAQISDRCIQFLNKFKELSGINCVIYTGGYFGRDMLDSRVKAYNGWIAHYGVASPMETGFYVVGHQYTESGNVSGISGNVDMNNFTDEILLSRGSGGSNGSTGDSNSSTYFDECKAYNEPNIIEIQSKLLALDYTLGGYGVDGIYGTGTHNSIGNFQRNNGLAVDYKFGPNTRAKANEKLSAFLCGIPYKTPGPTAYIQRKLSIPIDGIFGNQTASAVKALQQKVGISVDGIVGPVTWQYLL